MTQFPFVDYEKVSWLSDTNNALQVKYTASSKSLVMLELPIAGTRYQPGVIRCVCKGTNTEVDIFRYEATGNEAFGANGNGAPIGSMIINSGDDVLWSANNFDPNETIILHVFKLPSVI